MTPTPRMSLILSIVLIASGANMIITGNSGTYWGVPLPDVTGWVFLPLGIIIGFLSIRAIRRGEGKKKPRVYTDEEAARAEAEMDAMYLREHGELPEKPHKRP